MWAQQKEDRANKNELLPRQKKFIDSLFITAGGECTFDYEQMLSRNKAPYIKLKKQGDAEGEHRYLSIEKIDFSNNNLKGRLPENTIWQPGYEDRERFTFNKRQDIFFSYNSIESIPNQYFYVATLENYFGHVRLDHNKLKSVNWMSRRDMCGEGYQSLYMGSDALELQNNDITDISREQFATHGNDFFAIANQASLMRIDNNRFNMKNLIQFVDLVTEITKYYNFRRPGNPDFVFDYLPQKPIGGVATETTLNNGESHTLNYNGSHTDNIYTWQLNGKDVPLSNKTNYNFNVTDKTAGVWRCKITNPKLPDATLYTFDQAVWLSKTGNNPVTDITLSADKIRPGHPEGAIIGDFNATDPDGDEVYFRLIDGEADNGSFFMVDGRTLITTEEVFPYEFKTEYTIVVQAYDVYGATFNKTITLTKGEPTTQPMPKNILLSDNNIEENLVDVIGELNAVGVDGYTFSLPDNKDNSNFVIEGNNIKPAHKLDFEIKNLYQIRVVATKADNSLSKDFTIKVTNTNDNPSDIVLTSNTVVKDNIPGSVIGYLVAVDQDSADKNFTFETNSSDFVIEGNLLKSGKTFSETGTATLTIKVTDPHKATKEKNFTIRITDNGTVQENTAPTAIGLNNFIVKNDWTDGTQVSLLFLKDIDGDQGLFTLDSGDDSDYFKIDGDKLLVNNKLGDKTVYTISVTATDGEHSITAKINLYVPVIVNGIEQISDQQVKTAPNPVSGTLYLEYEGTGTLSFYNISGVLIKSVPLRDSVDCSDLNNGIYVVKAIIDNKTSVFKILKQ
jgi:hypothetical protein